MQKTQKEKAIKKLQAELKEEKQAEKRRSAFAFLLSFKSDSIPICLQTSRDYT